MSKKPRCYCLACNGLTIEYSRKKQIEFDEWAVKVGLITRQFADEGLLKFDEFHKDGGLKKK